MEATPCRVCGGTDLNLVDGYYYCVECGTQDVTARETVIEYIAREDGTFAHTTTKKIASAPTPGRDLSPEWYKWHILNFVVAGLGEELETLGAGPGFRVRLLWLWAKYMQKFQEKETLDGTSEEVEISESALNRNTGQDSNMNEQGDSEDDSLSDEKDYEAPTFSYTRKYSVSKQNMLVVQAILYAALNASESEIQAGDLIRFIKEERVSCKNYLRFIPDGFFTEKVVSINAISRSYTKLIGNCKIRGYAMTLYKTLKLGKPPAANLKKLVGRYVIELCLPGDFKDLVFSLMDFIPVSLELDFMEGIRRLPDYEGVAMAYVVITLKICFGLDGWYENTLSDAVARENEAKKYARAYKHSLFLDGTDRLFSFREWSVYLEFRKHIISKYYFPVAIDEKATIDNQVFISQTKDRDKKKAPSDIGDEVMMDVLDKLSRMRNIESFKTPKIDFPPSLTPLTTYSDAILRKSGDPVLEELLGEDFSQYSMKYVTGDLELDPEATLSGVSCNNLVIEPKEKIKHENIKIVKQLVFVRNCENENWLVTKPPNFKHLNCNEVDNSFISTNNSVMESESIDKTETEELDDETHTFDETAVKNNFGFENVFDDDFNVTKDQIWCRWQQPEADKSKELLNENVTEIDYSINDETIINVLHNEESTIEHENFDRDLAIEKLLDAARKEYKITTGNPRAISKRKSFPMIPTQAVENFVVPNPKKLRATPAECAKRGQAKSEIKDLCINYYEAVTRKQQIIMDINKYLDNDISTNNVLLNNSTQIQEPNAIDRENMNSPERFTDNNQNSNGNDEKIYDGDNLDLDDQCNDSQELSKENTNRFDENIYDKNQLYLKLKENIKDTSTEVVDDTIIELLRRKDKERMKAKKDRIILKDLEDDMEDDSGDSKIELTPVNIANEQMDTVSNDDAVSTQTPLGSPNLLAQSRDRDGYNYWIRHYVIVPNGFEAELENRFPRSFAWVMRMCANMIESTTFILYNHITHLENDLKVALAKK